MKIIPKPLKIEFNNRFSDNTDFKLSKCIDDNLDAEEYVLKITGSEIIISGGSDRALFYADKTLEQIKAQYSSLPICKICDKPKYAYRSFMIDCARHMFDVAELKKIINAMSFLKYNKFHWHITDDQGWRFESEVYDKLNSVSAVRPFSNFGKKRDTSPYGRVYTKAEMKRIVDYCAERYIDVIPEFDIPGHTSALLSAYPEITCIGMPVDIKTRQGIYKDVICPAKDKTYEIVTRIFDEFCEIFPYNYYHIGGDETPHNHWQNCPDCKKLMQKHGISDFADYHNFFMNSIIEYLSEKGKTCIVWNDVLKGKDLDKRAVVQYWKENDKNSVSYANNGGRLILSPFSYYYLDYEYDITPMNHTYHFNTELKGLTQSGKNNTLGVETPIWTEYIEDNNRLEEMMFPRVLAVAETGWSGNNQNYNDFLDRIEPAEKILKSNGIRFMEKRRWNYSRLAMPKGWLKFVFTNYTFDYVKSMLK